MVLCYCMDVKLPTGHCDISKNNVSGWRVKNYDLTIEVSLDGIHIEFTLIKKDIKIDASVSTAEQEHNMRLKELDNLHQEQ